MFYKNRLPMSYYLYRVKWWWCEHSYWIPKVPLHLDLELTNQCNLSCIMCRHGINPDSNQGQMDFEFAKSLIDQAVDIGIYSVKFQFRGESALYKKLEKLIIYSKNKGIHHTQLNTNLVAFNKERLIQICESGLDRLIISIDGATSGTYEKIRVGAKWSRLVYLLGVIRLIDIKPIIRIQMVHQDLNNQEIDTFLGKFRHLCNELHIKTVRDANQGGARKSCAQPRQRIVVSWNGDVFGCCNAWYNESFVGRISDTFTLKSIWNSAEFKKLRKNAKNPNSAEPCKSCLVSGSYK